MKRGGNPVDEARMVKEDETDVVLTTASLASVGERPMSDQDEAIAGQSDFSANPSL
jgi:hypothetical protein